MSDRVFSLLVQRKQMNATVLSLTLLMVTGCSTLSPTLLANQSTQATKPQTTKLNTASLLAQASPSPQVSQPYATDRQNQVYSWGYNEGYGDGQNNFPASLIGIESHNLTDPAEKTIYTNAYNGGYAAGKAQSPSPSPSPSLSPSPSPTNTISPARRTELQQQGNQDGTNDAQLGLAVNPGSGIATRGLIDPTEIRIYTIAYNAGYQRQSSPSPSISPSPQATLAPGQLSQLRQDGDADGYADAQANLPQDASRGINLRGLATAAEQRAYRNGYNAGYQRYLASVQPPPVNGALW